MRHKLWFDFCWMNPEGWWLQRPELKLSVDTDYRICLAEAKYGHTGAQAKLARFTAWRMTQ